MNFRYILVLLLLVSKVVHAENVSTMETPSESKDADSKPFIYFGLNSLPIGLGAALGAPVIPLEAGIRIFSGLSLGPMATFSGKYRYQETDLSLSGMGVQAMWSFGQSAIADGFFLHGFYQHYTLSGTKMTTISNLGFAIPLEGSLPINSMGGGVGYQWIWTSGFRISASVQVAYLKTDASGLNLMGMSGNDLSMMNSVASGSPVSENVNVPLMENKTALIPMPELSIGWSF